MNNINKKGEGTSSFGWIAGAFGLLLAIFIGWMLFGKTNTAISSADVFLSMNDYDGDGMKDVMDACPCGSDNVKQDLNGKSWCLAGLTQAQCGCADEFANSAMKADLKNKYTNREVLFMWDSGKCLYMKDSGCKYLVYADEKHTPNTIGTTCNAVP